MRSLSVLFCRQCALAIFFLGLGTLSGCAWFSSPSSPEPEQQLTPLAAFMAGHQPGDSATLNDPAFGAVRVTMLESFFSASGEACKRAALMSGQYESEMAVICQDAAGRWKLAPRIWGQGIRP